jgi:NAD(P)-dependent dehydrogenase (short-subunit alcohol dehydrogenase family)
MGKQTRNAYLEEMFGLSGMAAVITGGAGAIAAALGEALLQAGAKVALWGHHRSTIDPAVARLAAAVTGAEERLFGFEADAASEAQMREALEATERGLGVAPALLVNGVGGNRGKSPLVEQDMKLFEEVLRLNLVAGLMVPTKVFAAYWIERRIPGGIINLTSMSSYVPLSGVWAYDAAKAGVLNLTQASAKELAPHGIRVNAIAPGFFVGKQNRALLYDETGELTARGRASGFVTGVSLPVDGGYLVDNI